MFYDNVTDYETSKRLVSIGLKPETADYHLFVGDEERDKEVYKLGNGYNNKAAEEYSKTRWEYLPAWSLNSLITIMPDKITREGSESPFQFGLFKGGGNFQLKYFSIKESDVLVEVKSAKVIDAAATMIEWLIKNNCIKRVYLKK